MLVEFKGVPIEEIAKTMHHTCKTIQRYLSPDYSVEDGHYNARIPGKLAPYEAEVIKLRSEGMTYPNIISVKSLCFSSIVISTDALAYIILEHEEKNTMTFLSD